MLNMQMQFKLTSKRKLFSSVLNHAFVKLSDERITCMMINSHFLNVKNNRKSDTEQYSFFCYISVIISTLYDNLYYKKEWLAFRNSHTHTCVRKTSNEMRLTNNQKNTYMQSLCLQIKQHCIASCSTRKAWHE